MDAATLWCIGLLLTLCDIHAKVFNDTIFLYVNSTTKLIDRHYGFQRGAKIELLLNCFLAHTVPYDHQLLFILLCDGNTKIEAWEASNINTICGAIGNVTIKEESWYRNGCQGKSLLHNLTNPLESQYSFHGLVLKNYFYKVYLLPCELSTNDTIAGEVCQYNLNLINPGGKHLSSDEEILPVFYCILSLVWMVFMSVWVINWLVYKQFRNKLHHFITLVLTMKALHVLGAYSYWTGMEASGVANYGWTIFERLLLSLHNSLFLCVLLLIAEGWGLIRPNVIQYKLSTFIVLGAVVVAIFTLKEWIHRYFVGLVMMIIIFITFKGCKWMSMNLYFLRRRTTFFELCIESHKLSFCSSKTIKDQLLAKIHLLQQFRYVFTIHILMFLAILIVANFLDKHTFILAIIFEVSQLIVSCVFAALFRLRDFTNYLEIELTNDASDVRIMDLPDCCQDQLTVTYVLACPSQDKRNCIFRATTVL